MANLISPELRRRLKRTAVGAGLDAALLLKSLGAMKAAAGVGAIFTLHHVRPYSPLPFSPNRHLEVTPQFLDRAIRELKAEGRIFVALDELPQRIAAGGATRFAAFTLDDGNRNNVEHALPVFERHSVPVTIFVAKGLSERTHSMWWETLSVLLRERHTLAFDFGRGLERLDLGDLEQKQLAFERFAAFVHGTDEMEAVSAIDWLAEDEGIQPLEIVRALIMDFGELQALARHPWCLSAPIRSAIGRSQGSARGSRLRHPRIGRLCGGHHRPTPDHRCLSLRYGQRGIRTRGTDRGEPWFHRRRDDATGHRAFHGSSADDAAAAYFTERILPEAPLRRGPGFRHSHADGRKGMTGQGYMRTLSQAASSAVRRNSMRS